MKIHIITAALIMIIVVIGSCTCAYAWDVEYDASSGLLPTDTSPAWQSDGGTATVLNGLLSIGNRGEGYDREINALNLGVPVTVEARVLVAQSAYPGWMSLGTYGGKTGISIYSDRIVAGDINGQPLVYLLTDPTAFHTIRLAYDGYGNGAVWVDQQYALPLVTRPWQWSVGPPDGVRFGSYLADSYWQYVAYSKDYIPVPEPPSLLILAGGLLPVGAGLVRRKWRRS